MCEKVRSQVWKAHPRTRSVPASQRASRGLDSFPEHALRQYKQQYKPKKRRDRDGVLRGGSHLVELGRGVRRLSRRSVDLKHASWSISRTCIIVRVRRVSILCEHISQTITCTHLITHPTSRSTPLLSAWTSHTLSCVLTLSLTLSCSRSLRITSRPREQTTSSHVARCEAS